MSTRTQFYDTSPDEQVARLAELAAIAMPQWGLRGARISPVAYRENMTFKVDAAGRGSFALRIHQANYRTDAHIQSELDLMRYLSGEGISTPTVVPTANGALFTTVTSPAVGEPRQCDLFEWIEGRLLRETGKGLDIPLAELADFYAEVGRMAASIHNATERWTRPTGFQRPAWDSEGILGTNAHLGDFRRLSEVTEEQKRLLATMAQRVEAALMSFGQMPDRYGLSHCDFLAENVFICDDGLRLVDFDDAGDSWYLFDLSTAVFDLLETPAYEPCLQAILSGYRERRDLPEEHLRMLPTFVMARILSYLGWCAKKTHMPQTAWMRPVLLYAAEKYGADYVRG